MAHNLNIREDGTAAMFSLRQSPWHGLGRVIKQELKESEVAEAAGLDWTVLEKPIYHETNGSFTSIDGEKALVRSDTNQVMSVVSTDYRVFSNAELIALSAKIAGSTGVVFEAAGCLGKTGGSQWLLGYMPELDIRVRETDATKSYMLLANSHGQGRALLVMPTTIRVVCQNCLNMATRGGHKTRRLNSELGKFDKAALSTGYSVHHDGALERSLGDVVEAYQAFIQDKVITQEIYEQMAEVKVSKVDTVEYWNKVFGMPSADELDETSKARALKVARERMERLESILASPTCQTDATQGSLYGVLQSTTEFVDHFSLRRKVSATSQLSHSQFGAGSKLKQRAFDLALEMVA